VNIAATPSPVDGATENRSGEGVIVPAWKAKAMRLRAEQKKKFDAWLETNFPENLKVEEAALAIQPPSNGGEVAEEASGATPAPATPAVEATVEVESAEIAAQVAMQGMETS
jgi:hypothetical protein